MHELPTSEHRNEYGQPVGFPVPDWTERPRPPRTVMRGRYCRVESLVPERHARELHRANQLDAHGANWTYLSTDAVRNVDAPGQASSSRRSSSRADEVTSRSPWHRAAFAKLQADISTMQFLSHGSLPGRADLPDRA